MAGPTGSTSSRPSLETATGASTAVPPSAVSHGPGLTGRIAERHSPPCRACPATGTRQPLGQLAGELGHRHRACRPCCPARPGGGVRVAPRRLRRPPGRVLRRCLRLPAHSSRTDPPARAEARPGIRGLKDRLGQSRNRPRPSDAFCDQRRCVRGGRRLSEPVHRRCYFKPARPGLAGE